MVDAMNLKPWMRGPFELINHANEHFKDAGDTDRRIALIGFDNAIEVCVDVFLRLHPKLRHGEEFTNDMVEKAGRNYHTKIEFLDKYVADHEILDAVGVDEIVWYHQLRNELYHSGNGMVPEMHVVEGARAAALSVFRTLFKRDISAMFGAARETGLRRAERQVPAVPQNPEMEFMRFYIDFERTLLEHVEPNPEKQAAMRKSVHAMWRQYVENHPEAAHWTAVVEEASSARNAVVHGKLATLTSSPSWEDLALSLMEIAESMHQAV